MPKELFIATENHKILYGNPYKYPETAHIEYPVHGYNGKFLSQLKINNIILSVLYSKIDCFSAAKYLLDIKTYLETHLKCLDSRSVKANLRKIVELLEMNNECFSEQPGAVWENPLFQRNQYIDVIEKVHGILTPEGARHLMIEGEVVISQNNMITEMELELEFENGREVECKSVYDLKKVDGAVKISVDKICSGVSICSYTILNRVAAPIEFHKIDGEYVFKSEISAQFKELAISIPQPETTYSVAIKSAMGEAYYDRETRNVVWRMAGVNFLGETISVEGKTLDDGVCDLPIKVEFSLPNYSHSRMKVKSCKGKEQKKESFWIHYCTQNGRYEIRERQI